MTNYKKKRNKNFITAMAFFALVIVMSLWAVISSYMNGTLGSMSIFNFSAFTSTGEADTDGQATTTLITTVVIIICLGIFLVLGIKQHREESETITREEEILECDINDIDEMTQDEFDEYLVTLFKRMGYKSDIVTSPDNPGANVILHRENGEKVVVYAVLTKEKIKNDSVDLLLEAQKRLECEAAWLFTNSRFEKKTVTYARGNKMRLVDRKILMNVVSRATRNM